jgi:hypothetical protein
MILKQTEVFGAKRPSPSAPPVVDPPAYLTPVTTAQLKEGFDEPASVTDHTTRMLDEIPTRKA